MGRLTPVQFDARPECDLCRWPMYQTPVGSWVCVQHGVRRRKPPLWVLLFVVAWAAAVAGFLLMRMWLGR